MGSSSTGHRIDKEIFDGGNHLLDDIKGYAGALEPRFKLGNAPLCIVNHNVHTIAGKNQT
jgi:hypothetical protein